jgi:putative ABC transport system ATP-binding protein
VTQNNHTAVTVSDVTKIYPFGGGEVRALDGVSFSLERGVLAAIVGPSGSGKSTLLNLLGALDVPTSGQVIIDGSPLSGLSEAELTLHRRTQVGFIFQRFNLIPNLSSLENVMLPMEFARLPRGDRAAQAQKLLETVELSQRATHRPGHLSGGEQQRVAIARALANDPTLILADEPTGNLDEETGQVIVSLLGKLARERGKIVLMVTHDTAVADLADIILPIQDGKIVT